MINLGEYNSLVVARRMEQGIYLEDDLGNSVLLPNRYIPEGIQIADELSVFVYNDSEDRIVATTLAPKITLGKFASLEVVSVTNYGAFLDWGLAKDIFVPFSEQPHKLQVGDQAIVYLYLDKVTVRLVASAKLNRFLKNENITVKENEEVELLIADSTDIGVNVIINDKYKGILYRNEIFQNVHYGHRVKGYIKKIREDNKIDVSLQKQGYENVKSNEEKIMAKLQENSGFLGLNDYSSPEEITATLEMSKKTFKKAIGALFKQRLIRIEEKGIYLQQKKK
ncbi:MAG TPA: S1-like domain-containing RNA-binding protein [Bacteroidia bacterium]|nr:S1-like domain-containing RNA-binding protein [Bacteroidia bacterium]HNO70429.1 S1-like domain-containing RNA-binding protein [Bacteroidia bacterium]